MLTWRFALKLNCLLVELVGLVIEKTKSFPCVIVKKTFHVTCGVASFQIQKMKENGQEFSLMSGEGSFLNLFRDSRTPLDSISNKLVTLIYFVIVQCPSVGTTWYSARDLRLPRRTSGSALAADCQTLDVFKCPAMVKLGLSRFQKLIGELASVYHRYYSRCLENSYNLAS
ncbi:hypothetical protein pdam_00024996, partial [Pocillopora damicornis]